MATNLAHKIPEVNERRETYRDELNLAEFPLALLDRPSEGQKTVSFSDTIFDGGKKELVTRKLTISASDKYGLPTPRDEEVILGLIQLSHQSGFSDRKVHFTKGDLVRLLGWADDGRSYARITESLNKWVGITLYYEKAWWSKTEGCWVDETFHILDNITLFDKERYNRRVKQAEGDTSAGMSSFVWNETVYSSFKSGYIKQLDLNFYKELNSAISKKMFRFLDKRFYKSKKLTFDLQVFAFEHIGLSRCYHNSEIKRKLVPAILELEEKGFLVPMSIDARFTCKQRGEWSITFIKKGAQREIAEDALTEVGEELVGRGVTEKVAKELTDKFSEEVILEKIRLHDSLLVKRDKRVSKNAAGFLVSAIRDDFNVTSFKEKPKSELRVINSKPSKIENKEVITDEITKQSELDVQFDSWFDSLSIDEKEKVEQLAVERASPFQKKFYFEGKEKGGAIFRSIQRSLLLEEYQRTISGNTL